MYTIVGTRRPQLHTARYSIMFTLYKLVHCLCIKVYRQSLIYVYCDMTNFFPDKSLLILLPS